MMFECIGRSNLRKYLETTIYVSSLLKAIHGICESDNRQDTAIILLVPEGYMCVCVCVCV